MKIKSASPFLPGPGKRRLGVQASSWFRGEVHDRPVKADESPG